MNIVFTFAESSLGTKRLFLDFLKLYGLSFRVSTARRYPKKLSKNRKNYSLKLSKNKNKKIKN